MAGWRAPSHVTLALGLVILGGCAQSNSFRQDPLTGGVKPGPSRQSAAPAPTLGRSTASLAMDSRPRVSNGESALAIPGTAGERARVQPIRQAQWVTRGLTWEQAREMLLARGVTWQQLEMREGRWHFRCCLPNPQNPHLSRTFEATADDELGALVAVLERIDAERGHR